MWLLAGGDPDVCWVLLRELYGRRVAAAAWTEWFSKGHRCLGFQQCPQAPCIYHHTEKDITLLIHIITPQEP